MTEIANDSDAGVDDVRSIGPLRPAENVFTPVGTFEIDFTNADNPQGYLWYPPHHPVAFAKINERINGSVGRMYNVTALIFGTTLSGLRVFLFAELMQN